MGRRRTWLGVFGRMLLLFCALAFLLQVALAVWGTPRRLRGWVCARAFASTNAPDVAVVLGGGGIPSESGLIRTYYAAMLGQRVPDTRFIVSLPADGDPETSSVGRMRDELVMRGIAPARVAMEFRARDTHEQAVALANMLGPGGLDQEVMVISSPSHLRRAVLCFRKAGFTHLTVLAAVNTGAEADMGKGTSIRYRFWGNLEFQLRVVRELAAMAFYRMRGWI